MSEPIPQKYPIKSELRVILVDENMLAYKQSKLGRTGRAIGFDERDGQYQISFPDGCVWFPQNCLQLRSLPIEDLDEAVIDSVRQLVLIYGNGDKSYRSVRYHLKRCGQDTSYYPEWYRESADTDHVTKGAFSILMYLTFKHAEAQL